MKRDFLDLSKRQKRRILSSCTDEISSNSKKLNKSSETPLLPQTDPRVKVLQNSENVFDNESCAESTNTSEYTSGDAIEVSNVYIPPSSLHSNNFETTCTFESDSNISENGLVKEDNLSINNNNNKKLNLAHDLRNCIQKHNVTQSFTNDLLKLLRNHGHNDLPNDSRTLMNTPRTCNVINMSDGGKYIHIGLEVVVKHFISQHKVSTTNLELDINIDGLPLAKSSGSQFWPILGSIKTDFYTDPFIIGVFHGFKKPDPNAFLSYFINEYKTIETNGFLHINDIMYTLKLRCILCDAPARAMITFTKYHNAYFGCSKCICEGTYLENKVVFLSVTSLLRTNESFRSRLNPQHHRGRSILEDLEIDMINQIPLDPMHLLYLGVTKRLICLWVRGNAAIRFNKKDIELLDQRYISMKEFVTDEFARKPRTINEVDRWKATEFRMFLLYIGLIVMKDILSKSCYNHFVSFVVAVRLLHESNQTSDNIEYAKSLLIYYVQKFGDFYGQENITYNVHNLVHVADDVKNNGSLGEYSAFKYENYMYKIKQKLKHSRYPLEQISNRIMEELYGSDDTCNCPDVPNFPVCHYKDKTIFKVEYSSFKISLKSNDNICLLKNGQIIVIQSFNKIDNNLLCSAKYYLTSQPFFNSPCNSQLLGIHLVCKEHLSRGVKDFHTNLISKKCLQFGYAFSKPDYFVVIPLLH